jgi:hypothetical protein
LLSILHLLVGNFFVNRRPGCPFHSRAVPPSHHHEGTAPRLH